MQSERKFPVCVHLRGRCLPGYSHLVPDEELLETDPCLLDGSPAVVVELDNCFGHFKNDYH